MLDADGYPYAYLNVNGMRLEFRRAAEHSGLHADVGIAPIPQHKPVTLALHHDHEILIFSSTDRPPFVIAEMGNLNQRFDRALAMVDAAVGRSAASNCGLIPPIR